jgi:hypothetical protein
VGGIGQITTAALASSAWTARWAQISHESTQKRDSAWKETSLAGHAVTGERSSTITPDLAKPA